MGDSVKIDLPMYVTMRKGKKKNRYYYQRRKWPTVRLPDPLTPEFKEAYEKAGTETSAPTSNVNTFGWLCDQYLDSAEFTTKGAATKQARRRIIETMKKEKIDPKLTYLFEEEKVKNFNERHITVLRDRKRDAPNAANERLKVLRQIFKLAKSRKIITDNPVLEVENLKIHSEGHRTATTEQLEQYLAYHKSGSPNIAMRLLMAFGMRVSDLRILGPQHIKQDMLSFRTVKSGVLCDLVIPEQLLPELRKTNAMVFLRSENGGAFNSDKALSQRISKWFRQAGIEGITAHSVRKWLATQKAEDGVTEYQMMALFGWRDPKEARPYVRDAKRIKISREAHELSVLKKR